MKLKLLIAFLLLFGFVLVHCEFAPDYFSQHAGEKVYRLLCPTRDHFEQTLSWATRHDLDVWSVYHNAATDAGYVDVRCPLARSPLLKDLPEAVRVTLFVDDVAQRLREQLLPAATGPAARVSDPAFFLSYHNYEEILSFMQDQARRFPQFVQLFQFGTTVEGRAIMALRIAHPDRVDPPEVLLNGGIHAREWIGVATMTYLIDALTERLHDGDPAPGAPLSAYAWTVVPVLNVDGYVFSWTKNRMWRKNRRVNSASCIGVDNNRNFPFHFGITAGGESSANPCSEAYHGPAAASEPETQALIAFFQGHAPRMAAYFDIHAYGELYLTPWGYTFARPPLEDFWLQNNCSTLAVQAIYQVHKQTYINGEGATTIYPTSGDTTDTSYGLYNIVYSQTLELRGPQGSSYGFLLPANQIIPQGQEFMAGLEAALTFIHQHPPANLLKSSEQKKKKKKKN